MSRLRSLWFESRHLGAGAPGLRAELAALDDAARDEILAIGDRLAALSLTLAQHYCRQAPAAWSLGPRTFSSWLARAERLVEGESGSREAGIAYLTLPAAELAALPDADVDGWIALAFRILAISRRLGEVFLTASAPVLTALDNRMHRLARWVEQGLGLIETGGWEGELVALHFFEATGLALPLFAPDDFAAWAALARAVEGLGSARSELFVSVPTALHEIPESDRGAIVRLAARVAERAPVVALEIYFSLPNALVAFPAERAALLASLDSVAGAAPETLPDLLPVLRAILEGIPDDRRAAVVAVADVLGEGFPRGVVPFYRVLPRLLERTGMLGVERWAYAGLRIADEHPGAGAAYFALDSRTSRATLAAESTAVELPEVQGLLVRYLHMLTGGTWRVAADAEAHHRPPFAGIEDDGCAHLPPRLDVFPTAEANLRHYRLVAAQHAGRAEFGSYALEPPLAEFLSSHDHPELAAELFKIFEGVRVDAALARAYRGLAADLDAARDDLARAGVRLPGTIVHLSHVLRETRLPELAGRLPALVESLASATATVADSARATTIVYEAMVGSASAAQLAGETGALDGTCDDSNVSDARLLLDDGGQALGSDPGVAGDRDAPADAIDQRPPALALAPEIDDGAAGAPMDPAELLRLLKLGTDLNARQGSAEDLEALGLYVSDLAGKLPRERAAELQGLLRRAQARAPLAAAESEGALAYDEWDYQIGDYRHAWCHLTEVVLESDTGDFFHRTLATHADLLPEVRRQFQRIRPERYRIVHGLEDGEDFDLNAVVEARADRRSGSPPSPKVYQARQREERDVATLFLVDMSASTDEPVPDAPAGRRVIDITKEALVVMAEALDEIGDTYGIYGFSGHGRHRVEFYTVKQFSERLTGVVKGRVGAIEPRRSTRMGTALRHAIAKMRSVAARSKHILLLSDGFPQDLDYGDDRRSNVYGIQDTMVAFQEAARAGVTPFCITVDKAGHDYLKLICDASRYLVIEDITALPRELPKIYQRFVRP